MSDPAPYTRETLDRIRKGATAQNIGWSDQQFSKVCKLHGIDPARNVGTVPPLHIAKPLTPESPKPVRVSEIRAQASDRRKVARPLFKVLREKIAGVELFDDHINVKISKTCRQKLGEQAVALGLTTTGLVTLMLETVARQKIAGLIIGIEAEAGDS